MRRLLLSLCALQYGVVAVDMPLAPALASVLSIVASVPSIVASVLSIVASVLLIGASVLSIVASALPNFEHCTPSVASGPLSCRIQLRHRQLS